MASETNPPTSAGMNPYALLQEQIQRRQAIADALLQQGFAKGDTSQMVSGHYVGNALGDTVSKLASIMAANKMRSRNTEDQMKLYGQYGQASQQAVKEFYDEYQKDPRGAVARGLASNLPAVQSVAKEFAGKLPTGKDLADITKENTGASAAAYAQTGNPADLQKVQFGPVQQGPAGTVYQTNQGTGEVNSLHPGAFTSVNVSNMPENAILTAVGKDTAENLGKSRQKALSGQQQLAALDSARSLIASGVFNNTGAGMVPVAKQLYAAMGGKEDLSKLANNAAAKNILLLQSTESALEAASARGMNQMEEKVAMAGSAANPNATEAEKLSTIDVGRMKLANEINAHQKYVNNVAGSDTPEMQKSANLVRSAYGLSPVQLESDRFKLNDQGMYEMLPPSTQSQPLAPGVNTGTAQQPALHPLLQQLQAQGATIEPVP